jgi:hypothetical protein
VVARLLRSEAWWADLCVNSSGNLCRSYWQHATERLNPGDEIADIGDDCKAGRQTLFFPETRLKKITND